MAFPRRLLHDGEELVVDLRPHWSFFAVPALLLGASVVGLTLLGGTEVPEAVLLLMSAVTLVALGGFVVRYLRWATTNFVVTTERIVHRSGVMAKQATEIPLERVNTMFSRQSVIERLLRCGDLVIESGGGRGRQSFNDIPHPSRVQHEVYSRIEEGQRRTQRPGGSPLVDHLERLEALRQRGVLTRDEFESEKARLLNRL